MDISLYIVELITLKDQVIVPGLGKFYKKRLNGFFDEKTETYYPPQQTINFTTEYHHDDKLVQFISDNCAISLTTAYAQLDEYVKEIKIALKNGAFEIPNFGYLSLVKDQISFESSANSEKNDDYFGLNPIASNLNPIQNIEKEETVLAQPEPASGKEEELYSLADQALLASISDEEKKPKNIFQYILIFIIVGIIAADAYIYYQQPAIFNHIFTSIGKKPEQALIPKLVVKKPIPDTNAIKKADSIYEETDISADLKSRGFEVEKVKDAANVSIQKKSIPKKSDIRYEIIIGLYLKKDEAIKRVALLKSNGINAYIVEDADGPMIKISGATLYDKNEAEKELQRIREELNPEAFIKSVKPLK
jgi:hypothetical protein